MADDGARTTDPAPIDEAAALVDAVRGRWMIGAPAAAAVGGVWSAFLKETSPLEAELRLAALAGQALQLALRPEPPQGLEERPDLPALEAPVLEEACRGRFRRLFGGLAQGDILRGTVLGFLAARGRVAHPGDYTPKASDDDAPAIYAPWIAWAQGDAPAAAGATGGDALTAANWSDFGAAERRHYLKELRRADPDAARALLEACAGAEPADRRLKLVEILRDGLSEADAPYLETLLKDRAQKVRILAQTLLARLGRGAENSEDAAELAGFFDHKASGVLSSGRLNLKKLKTGAQRNRRTELMEALSLDALAVALNLGAAQVLQLWTFGFDRQGDESFLRLVERTAPDALFEPFFERLAGGGDAEAEYAVALAERASPTLQKRLFERRIASSQADLRDLALTPGAPLGAVSEAALTATAAVADLKKTLTEWKHKPAAERRGVESAAGADLLYLGLLADPEAARTLLDLATGQEVLAVDPILDMLHLNIALGQPPERQPPQAM